MSDRRTTPGSIPDVAVLELVWRRNEQDLAVACLLMAGNLTTESRQEVVRQLEGDEKTPARRVIVWALKHGELAKRGPIHAYLAFHGDPDAQEICVVADTVLGTPHTRPADFFARSLRATNDARAQYRGEQAVLSALKGASR